MVKTSSVQRKRSIEELMYSLVAVQSDTGTKLEVGMAEHIFNIIKEDKYFKENPHLCGCFYNGDALGRQTVWALKPAVRKTGKTIILNSHYDATEIECYSSLKHLALKPDELKGELRKLSLTQEVRDDLDNPNWCFGRATADMKSGIAVNLGALFDDRPRDINILFVSTFDEENTNLGMMDAVTLLLKLKEEHDLDYRLLILTEPHARGDDKAFTIYNGSVGKILPCVVAKGRLSHVGFISSGLNPILMMAEVVKSIEMNKELCLEDLGSATPPPTVLHFKDSKTTYDVSIPEYVSMYFNQMFLKNTPVRSLMDKIRSLCTEALKKAVPVSTPEIYSFGELESICKTACLDYEEKKAMLYSDIEMQVREGSLNLQDAGILIIKETIKLSNITEPLLVLGLLPPYMPAVNNRYLPDYDYDATVASIAEVLNQKDIPLNDKAYFMVISDNSYTMCEDSEAEKRVLSDMVVPDNLYRVDFDSIAKLSVPSVVVGPWGKDYHTITERVYMPDVTDTVPAILENIIKNLT